MNEIKQNSWDRIDGESSKAFSAFQFYLQLVPRERSIRRAWNAYQGKGADEQGKPHGYFSGWYTKYEWKQRATDFDSYFHNHALEMITQRREELVMKTLDGLHEVVEIQRFEMSGASFQQRTSFMLVLLHILKAYLPATSTEKGEQGEQEQQAPGLTIILDSDVLAQEEIKEEAA